jgi:hypothetical protein
MKYTFRVMAYGELLANGEITVNSEQEAREQLKQLYPHGIVTSLEPKEMDNMVIQRWNGREMYTYDYYHSEACQPETMIKGSGMQWPIPLADLTADCVCAGCGGNIHASPIKSESEMLYDVPAEGWDNYQIGRN